MRTELTSCWNLYGTHHPTLAGRLRIHRCELHLHDTYTIALMRRGTAPTTVRGQPWVWSEGSIFVASPYEVHGGGSVEGAMDYEVFYPSVELIFEALQVPMRAGLMPRFVHSVMRDDDIVAELSQVLFRERAVGACTAAFEEDLMRCLRHNSRHFSFSMLALEEIAPVREAYRIMQESLESSRDASCILLELPAQVGVSRFHFIRLFHKVTGLAPNAYLRQLRLSKARRLICSGYPVAAAALEAGFADQAHLTREFRRSFGCTPGKVARAAQPRVSGRA